MAAELIYSIINIPYFSTGRCLYALTRLTTIAATMGDEDLISLIKQAIAHGEATADLERAWERSRNLPKARGEAYLGRPDVPWRLSN